MYRASKSLITASSSMARNLHGGWREVVQKPLVTAVARGFIFFMARHPSGGRLCGVQTDPWGSSPLPPPPLGLCCLVSMSLAPSHCCRFTEPLPPSQADTPKPPTYLFATRRSQLPNTMAAK